jgi:hypothetical protein
MWLKQSALVVASLIFALVIIELMLRMLGWSFPLFAQPDRDLGWSFRPGVSGWSTHENTAHLRINRYGFRGPDWTEKPAGQTIRIAMLGDSFVDAANVAEDEALNRVVEKELKTCPAIGNRNVEVLNFGVSGYGTAQQYLLLQQQVAAFQPELVVLAFYAGNDVMNNSRALSIEGQKTKPYFVESSGGELQLDMSFRDSGKFKNEIGSDWRRRLVNSSYVLQILKQIVRKKPAIPEPKVFKNSADAQTKSRFQPESVELFSPPSNETWRSAWAVTEKILLQMRDWSKQRNIAFGVVIIPDPIEALPGEDRRRENAQAIKAVDLDYPVRRLAQFGAQNDVSTLSLLDPFRSYQDRERVFLYGFPPRLGDGHLNASGNQVGGKLISDWLCRRLAQ